MCKKVFVLTDKCEFIPDKEMEEKLWFNIRASAFVFNKTLEYSIYRRNLVKYFGIGKTYKVNRIYTQKIVKTLKKNKPFLKDAESTCLQASTDRLIQAYEKHYNQKKGFPKFKSQKRNPVNSITLRNNEYQKDKKKVGSIRWDKKGLRINKLGYIKVRHKRDIDGKIKEATIKHENGRWYVCISYEIQEILVPKDFSKYGMTGIDVGLTDFLTFSNGRVIAKPDLNKINGKIRYYQQKMARQKEGGSNWKKTLQKLNRWETRKNNVVNDYYHKVSYNIVKHYRFIAMETLNIRGMIKCHNISHAIHEIGWGKFIDMIKYKSQWYNRIFIQIDRWFPSSKKCYICGEIYHDLGRGERVWECPHCHTIHNRDWNAALNILDEGLRAAGSSVHSLVDYSHIFSIIPKENIKTITICES